MDKTISIKFHKEVLTLDPDFMLSVDDNNLIKDYNDTLMNLSWVNTLVTYYGRKASFARIARDAKRGEFFLDSKTNHDGKPPSDKTVEMEIAEEGDLIKLDKKYITLRFKAERIERLSQELRSKLDILRTIMANQRAEMNLQK